MTVRVGLREGFPLSPYLFDMILGVMGRGIKEQSPWYNYAVCRRYTVVLCSTRREHVERKLDEWRRAMEERGLKTMQLKED